MLGKALGTRRHDIVLATKVRGRMGPGPNQVGLSRLHIIEAVEGSLKRLGTDYIDLYQVHRSDVLTNLEDTLRALDALVRAGKVRYIGCSNLEAWVLMKALAISSAHHLDRFRCTQSYYSLVGRDLGYRGTIPLLKEQGLGLLVWSPSPAVSCRASLRDLEETITARRAKRLSSSRSTRGGAATCLDVLVEGGGPPQVCRPRRLPWHGCWQTMPSRV